MIAGKAFSGLRGRAVTLEELMDYPLVSMEKGTMTRQFFDDFFHNYNLTPEPDIELATTDLIVPIYSVHSKLWRSGSSSRRSDSVKEWSPISTDTLSDQFGIYSKAIL